MFPRGTHSLLNANIPAQSSGSDIGGGQGSLVSASAPVDSAGSSAGSGSLVDASVPVRSGGIATGAVGTGTPVAPLASAAPSGTGGADNLVNVDAPVASNGIPGQHGAPVAVALHTAAGSPVRVNTPVADGTGSPGHASLVNANAPLLSPNPDS
jgi:hypothetical protein